MNPAPVKVGDVFGSLEIVELLSPGGRTCICKCLTDGRHITTRASKLRSGHTTSCGCSRTARFRALITKHRLANVPEYNVWCGIKSRCLRSSDEVFSYYGGRGITVCERWMSSFQNFYADMGPRPTPLHTIERNDNDGNYEKDNCSWATREDQCNNTRRSIFFDYGGERLTIGQWAKRFGVKRAFLAYGLSLGMTMEQALVKRKPAGRFSKKRTLSS